MSVKFSVAMATYNGERYLREQLESVARQTLPPFELVVCDDGSADSTLRILDEFARSAPFPVHVHRNQRNLGYGDNFLRAISLCRGEWIALCDQDDVWLDHKLERCVEVLAGHSGVDLLSHSADQVDEELRPLPHRVPNHARLTVTEPFRNVPFSVLAGFSCCVRKALFDRLPAARRPAALYPLGRREPHDVFIYHLANTYGRIARLPDSLALYRRHASAATGQENTAVYDRSLRARLRVGSYAGVQGFLRVAEQARQRQEFYQAVHDEIGPSGRADAFAASTANAVRYYAKLASAFEVRARIYEADARLGARARAFAHGLRHGVYLDSRLGRGLGSRSLLKDAARVFVQW